MSNNDKRQNTSRTDALVQSMISAGELVPAKLANHAEQLERELAEAKEQLATIVEGRGSDEVAPEHYSEVGRRNWRIGQLLGKLDALKSATTPTISGVKVAMRLKQQRDELADALRALLAVVENNLPMPAGVRTGSPMDLARKALAQVPTYEQQLRNICEGVGIDYEQMISRYVLQKDSNG